MLQKILILGAALFLFASPARAQESKLDDLLSSLESKDSEKRQRASRGLRLLGPKAKKD